MEIKKIAILASGNGSNAERIINHFENKNDIKVSLILSNNADAYVLTRAEKHDIPNEVFSRDEFYQSDHIIEILKTHEIDFLVLAGFLWLIPMALIKEYPNRIVNIHPALLPKYGGKGMYGNRVHKAVKMADETESGITIHWVNERYDEGQIIFQAKCMVTKEDTPETIAEKVHLLEYQHYPAVIESVLKS